MTPVDQLLLELRQRDVSLWLEGDRLRYRAAKDALTPDLLAQLKAQKAEVITFLRQASASTQLPPIQPIEHNGHLPLSFAQQRLWFLHQFEPESTSNNMPVVVRFTGCLDVEALEKSIQAVVRRQEVLRTRFPAVNGQPALVIEEDVNITLPLIDLRQLPDEERDAEALKLATQEARQPFDLANGPILRVKLFRLCDDEHLLIWNLHCIICDGASSDVFYQDLTAIYKSLVTGKPLPLADLPVQYVDFAHWQRQWLQGEVLETQLNYWKQTLAGDLPVIQLPFDHPRPTGVQTYRGDRGPRMLPPALNEALNHLSQQLGATLFMTLLAAFETLLYRYSGQVDMLISFASAGRGQVETEGLIGFFSNTLMQRTNFQGNPTFRELLNRVKEASLQAYAHQDIPFEKLVEELRPEQNQRSSPLFQIKFALNPPWSKGRGMASVQLPDLTITSLFGYIYHGKTKYDLTLVMREQDEGLGMVFDYNADIFETSTIARMIDHFHILLEGIVANPDQRISELPLLTASEQHQLLVEWNQTNAPYPEYASIQQVFEGQVAANPDAIALVSGEVTLTYRDLNQQANKLAHYLRQLGVTTETPVGIYLERSPATLVAILAVLKAGGTYVPLDPRDPSEHLIYVLEDTQAPFLLTQQSLAISLAGVSPKVINLDAENRTLQHQSQENLPLSATANTLASILYLKNDINSSLGICTTHRGIVQLVKGNPPWKLAAETRLLHRSSVASEIAPFELFGALLNGGTVVMAPAEASGKNLGKLLKTDEFNTLWLPTRLFHHLVTDCVDQLQSVKTLLIGGDVLSIACVQKLLTELPHCTLIKTVSLPENTGFTCGYALQAPLPANVPHLLGTPLGNTQVYVLDQHQQPVPVGVVGELYVAGAGLAKGYHHRPDLTTDRFGVNPFNCTSNARLYKTGYLVRYLPDGNLEHVGITTVSAIASEIDLHAHRLTVALHQHPEILEAVVVAREELLPGENYVAYIIPASQSVPDASDLQGFLKQQGMTQQLPIAFISLSALPITSEGAVDYQALPVPDVTSQGSEISVVAARNDLEEKLVVIWEEILRTQPIGIQDNYFELGGNSLQAVQLFARIEQVSGKNLPLATLFQAPTIEKLANFLNQEENSVSRSALVPIQPNGTKPPLFCIHGAGLNVLIYKDLADNLGPDYPVYGVQAYLPDGSAPHVSQIDQVISYYLQEIRRCQPEGPYFLAGLSKGGNFALKIAQLLQAEGQVVALLALFDSNGPNAAKLLSPFPRLLSSLQYALRYSLPRTLCKLQKSSIKALLTQNQPMRNSMLEDPNPQRQADNHLSDTQGFRSPVSPQKISFETLEQWMDQLSQYILNHSPWSQIADPLWGIDLTDGSTVSAHLKQLREVYEEIYKSESHEAYDGRVALFRAEESPPGYYFDPYLGWNTIVKQGVDIYKVPGHHISLVKSKVLANKLRACIEEAMVINEEPYSLL